MEPVFSIEWLTATSASISAGDPTTMADNTGASTGVVGISADGDPITTANHRFAGIAKSDSTDTAALTGKVEVWLPLPGIIYEGLAKTSTDANTAAKVAALVGKRTVLDLTSTTWSVDAGASDGYTKGIVIVGGNPFISSIYFTVSPSVTFLGNAIA